LDHGLRHFLGLILPTILAVVGPSCGDRDAERGSATGTHGAAPLPLPVRRLDLVRGGREAEALPLCRITPPADLSGWTIESTSHELIETEEGHALTLKLSGASPGVIRIPAPALDVDPRLVEIWIALPRGGDVGVAAHFRDGTRLTSSVNVLPPPKARLRVPLPVRVPLPERQTSGAPLQEIEVRITGRSRSCLLSGLELHRFALLTEESEDGEPELVDRGRVARRARTLSGSSTLTAELQPGNGDCLELAFAVVQVSAGEEDDPALTLNLSRGGERVLSWRGSLTGHTPGWTQVLIPLDDGAGRPLTATIALEGGAPEDLCLVERPRVVHKEKNAQVVLLITSDTHRADHVGAGSSAADLPIETPVLDRLARDGVMFTSCLATTNITNPSHVAMLCGVHPRETRILDNRTRLASSAPTLASAFRDQGFLTAAVTSVGHLGWRHSGLGTGFDVFVSPEGAAPLDADEAVSAALDLVLESGGVPLFLWLHLYDAHFPYAPPQPFDRLYYPEGRDPRSEDLPPLGELPSVTRDWLPGLRDIEYPRALYRGEISFLDQELGRLLAHPGLETATIVFTADHGECLGQHGIYYDHTWLYPDTLHVPLLLRSPDLPAGRVVSRAVSHLDLGRTILDLAGMKEIPFPGTSLLPLVMGRGPVSKEPLFALSDNAMAASVTHEGWHLILSLSPRPHPRVWTETRRKHQVELFDLTSDPECTRDRIVTEPERARDLCTKLVSWLGREPRGGWTAGASTDPELVRRLEALGYVTGEEEAPLRPLLDPGVTAEALVKTR